MYFIVVYRGGATVLLAFDLMDKHMPARSLAFGVSLNHPNKSSAGQ